MIVDEGRFKTNDRNCEAANLALLNLSLWLEHILNEAKDLGRVKHAQLWLVLVQLDHLHVKDVVNQA